MTEPVTPPDSPAYREAGAAQSTAANPAHSAWVSANAGSGKTKVLIDRVARLLLNDAKPDAILCITYTRAAANEMIGRLFDRLGNWSVMAPGALAAQLAQLEGRSATSYSDDQLKKARALFARALETPGGLRIETIHAFCSRILRRFPLEAGIVPGFADLDEAEADALWRKAAKSAVLSLAREAPDTLDTIAREGGGNATGAAIQLVKFGQAALAHAAADPAGVAAKLRAALGAPDDASAASLLERAVITDLPLADYQRAISDLAAGSSKTDIENADRLTQALGSDDPAVRFSLLQRLFRTAAGALGKKDPYTKATGEASPALVDMFQVKDGEGYEITRLKAVERDFLALKAIERTQALLALARPMLAHYRAAKAARGALDFDDLIERTRNLLSDPAVASWVLYKLDGKLSHVLLDEAQDTSPDQWTIVDALTAEFFAGHGAEHAQDPRTLFVVGDEKQSIYSFQGADPAAFLDGLRAFEDRTLGQGKLPEMNMSFRSSPEVLQFVDTVFDTDAFDGPAFAPNPPESADLMVHTARRANQPGRVELWPLEPPPETEDDNPWDAPVDAVGERSPKARLARDIAAQIDQMIETGQSVWAENPDRTWSRRPMRAEDVLILVRGRTGGLFDALIQQLKQRGLPVAGADRLRLTDHIGVQDCLNLMRFALFPSDDLTVAEILRGPFCDLVDDDAQLFPLAYKRGAASLWERVCASEDPDVAGARDFLETVLSRRHLPAFEFLSAALNGPVLGEETGWDRIGTRLGKPARDPVEALVTRALGHDCDAGSSLQTFLAEMQADASQIKRDLAEPDGAIRIMTVHGAKGLQAPVVILPDTTPAAKAGSAALLRVGDDLPLWAPRKGEDTDTMAAAREAAIAREMCEHRRLLYVALTRAQDRLIICGHWHGGEKSATGMGKDSWYGLCLAGMEKLGAPEDDAGVRALGALPPECAAADEAGTNTPAQPGWLRAPAPQETAGRRAISPSSLVPDEGAVLDPLGPRPPDRRLRGRLIHSLLERLPDMPDAERPAMAAAFLERETALSDEERREIAATALATLNDPAMADVFAPHGRAEAAIVGTGTGWPPGTLINGRVDRLIMDSSAITIVDIKTDRPPPADESGVGESYLAQMAAYANVMEAGFPGREVTCAIVWTDGPRLMPLSRQLLLDALNRAQSAL